MSPNTDAPPPAPAEEMRPLLARGADAFLDRCLARGEVFHGTIYVVTQADYVGRPMLCLRHAVDVGPLHILCDGGEIFALLAQLKRR